MRVRRNPMPSERFFLGQDCSGHWYIVPLKRAREFNAWSELDENDEDAWDVPSYARRIGGPGSITFTEPQDGR